MANLKELSKKPEFLASGHRMCPGCGAAIIARQVLHAVPKDEHVLGASATGCLEVSTTIFPYTSWNCSFIHNAFENVAATISGVEAAYRALRKAGKIKEKINMIAFGGDGGTYDIGLQSLSGMLERGHNVLYIAYDNEAYMNTGIQRSSATPMGADTTTSPVGEVIQGKQEYHKDLTRIVTAHKIPYVAQASISHWNDLITKVEKALSIEGPKFINILSPCPLGWRSVPSQTVKIAKLAVETCFWPLYEVTEQGRKWTVTYKPANKLPLAEWLKLQGRFKHLEEAKNQPILEKLQQRVDKDWEYLLEREKQVCL